MKRLKLKFVWTLFAAVSVTFLANCGGNGSATPPPPPPPPPPLAITTSSLPGSFYGEFYTASLQSSGGTGAKTWTLSSGFLPQGLNLDHSTGVISGFLVQESTTIASFTAVFDVTVQDGASKVATKTLNLDLNVRPENILTTSLPDAVIGRQYRVRLATTQPTKAISFDLTQGLPPVWLSAGSPQTLSGLVTGPAGQFTFVVQMATSGAPAQRFFTLNVVGQGAANRNEDVPNARTVSNGTYFASISPLTDPATSVIAAPDNDFYRLTAQPGATVSIEITAERNGSPLDSVIELVDSAGLRLNTCNSPGQSSFTNPCMDDDNQEEGTLDSKLLFRAPAGAPSTFFLHVIDWRGDGRPDMTYQFQIFGAN
jgi:Putative Ig domain